MKFILEIMRKINELTELLSNKTDKGHSHDISNISGLEGVLDNLAITKDHDVQSIKKIIHSETRPRFLLNATTDSTKAFITVRLITTNGYCLTGLEIIIRYREAFKSEWVQLQSKPFFELDCSEIIIENLIPNTSYHIELIVRDRYNPLLDIAISDMFRTGV